MAEKILRTEYSEEMQKSYLDYSMREKQTVL